MWSAVIASTLVAPAIGETTSSTVSEINDQRDLEWYATAHGVSLLEGEAQLATMDIARELQADLRASQSDAFGGLWISHEPHFQVVVNMLEGQESRALPYIDKLGLADVTQVVAATYTEDELHRDQDAVATKVPLGGSYATGIDIRLNRVNVYVESEQDVAVYKEAEFAPSVVVVQKDLPTPQVQIYGGLTLSNGCTSGFSVQKINSSTEGVTTAGHCTNAATYAGVALTFIDDQHVDRVDAQWYTTPGGLTDPNIIRDDQNGSTRAITSRRTRSEMMVGDHVCHYGMTSHYGCGDIDDVSYGTESCVLGSSPPDNTYIYVNNTGGDIGEDGDSGGPWFLNNRAWGTHVCGQEGIGDNGDGIFMAQNFLSNIGVVVDIT
jgi:hypothetical protein